MKKGQMIEILISLILILMVAVDVGILVFDKREERAAVTETTTTEVKPLYGTVEYVSEVPMEEWVGSAKDFHPVECSLDEELQEFIFYLSYGYNIDFYFIMAVIEHESNYRTDVISKTNDYGLMQINECNHKWMSEALGITDFLDPYQNVIAGTYKFWTLFERHGNDTSKVLMAYNMGSSSCKRDTLNKINPYSEGDWQEREDYTKNGGVYGYIYHIYNRSNNMHYIGQTVYMPFFRWQEHAKQGVKGNITDLQFEVITEVRVKSQEYLNNIEAWWIRKFIDEYGKERVMNLTVPKITFEDLQREYAKIVGGQMILELKEGV